MMNKPAQQSGCVHSVPKGDCCDHGGDNRAVIVRLIAGAVILAAGILLERFAAVDGYAALAVFAACYLLLGGDVLLRSVKNIARGQVFDENFLMAAASIGAFAIGEYAEAAGVMLFYQAGELLQDTAVHKSKKSIADLMDIRPDSARLKRDGELITVSPETVRIGDVIVVGPGEKIPLDGVVLDGEAMLDAGALTGESVPRKASPSDAVLSGCVNQNGVLTIKVTQTFGESTVSKIIGLVENAASKKAPTENFITKFALVYTPAVTGLAALLALIPPLLFGGVWSEWLSRGLVFLVISCPCALVISIPLGFFGGIGGASRRGILVKGGNYLEALAHLDFVVFDKTGTLTKGVFDVTEIRPANGFSGEELLEAAANAESFSNHPIALSIRRAYGKPVDKNRLSGYEETAGRGVSVCASGRMIAAGNHELMDKMGVIFEEPAGTGTKVHIAADGVYMGCIAISDEIKRDSHAAVAALKARGVRKAVMLTGDDPQIAETVAKELKLDEVYGGLLPQQKVEMVETLNGRKRANGKLAFVGDGVNDAPVLALADVGVAMGGLGSDAAIEAADVVLMTDEPSKLAEAVDIARFTKRVVRQNIVFALGIKGVFLLLGAFGITTMWEAVFADVGVALLATLNAMRVMRMKY
jgi:Cd2+/Zn2+-exporting ATPase